MSANVARARDSGLFGVAISQFLIPDGIKWKYRLGAVNVKIAQSK
ncbi:hypothetical protein [Rhizobium sp. CF080]|nr:hypothetical protein [Rhizobium sp. CF080]